MATRILLADDHPVVRLGLRDLLAEQFAGAVIGEARTIPELIERVQAETWDILVLDLSIPGAHGLDAFRSLKQIRPNLPVLVLTIHPEDQFGVRALRAGAAGYLNKETAPEELVSAVRRILSGGTYMSPTLAEAFTSQGGATAPDDPHEALSEREYQVFCMIAGGKTLTAIGRELGLSLKTISTYQARIREKTKLLNREEITHYAIRQGLVR
jgi:two-component system, NarL family, invasion response regulator UvrY